MRDLALVALLLLGAAVAARADGAQDLEFFEEEAKVVTASRRPEYVRQAPAAVDVITAEQIRESGALNLWDLLRFRAGMNVVDGRSGEGNRALVSIRGFPAEFVDDLLVLVDGRSVYTALSGGAVWEELPVQLQDIERIEIIRGPSAALYGSNAGLGVINIITRKPQKDEVSGGALEGNRARREEAAAERAGPSGGWRLSATHEEQEGNPTAAGPDGQDYLFSNKGNLRGLWTPSERHTLELFAGGTWQDLGVVETGNPDARFRHDFEMVRHTFDASSESSVQTMLSRRDDVRTYPMASGGLLTAREYQYDAEVAHRLDWLDSRLHTVYGGSWRYTGVDSAQLFLAHPYQKNAVSRGFVSQAWEAVPGLNLVGAVSLEHSDTGGTQPAWQAAAIAEPWRDHVFRASYGMAPTIPTLYDKAARQQANAATLLVGDPGMTPQRLSSYELSYQGAFLDRRAHWETNLFYMRVDRLSETVVAGVAASPPLTTLTFDNGNSADARGAEIKAGYRWSFDRSVDANYTYETISDAKGAVNAIRGTPAHKLNLGGTTAVVRGVALSANAGWQDAHALYSQAANQTADIPAYWRLDARLAWTPRPGLELFAAGQNLLRSRHVEFADGLVVPRTYEAGATVRF